MASAYEVRNLVEEIRSLSIDEIAELIIDLREKNEEQVAEIETLTKRVAELEEEQS
jgi:hypothetical protein